MAVDLDGYINLRNKKTRKSLNLYAGDTSSESNVVQWITDLQDDEQLWKIKRSGTDTYVLEIACAPGYVLDAYSPKTSGANADIWSDDDPDAQRVRLISVGNNHYKIMLKEYNIYLTAIGTGKGTQYGYSSTSDGNVYWLPENGDDSQVWEFIIPENGSTTTYPTVSNHSLVRGKCYQLTNANTAKNLNLWNGDYSKESNVVQWTANRSDRDQMWILIAGTVPGTDQLETGRKNDMVLDAYNAKASGANTDVWANNDPDAQNLVIRRISGNQHTVSLHAYPNLFLTAIGNDNGTKTGYTSTSDGNVYWKEYTGGSDQKWNFTEVSLPEYPIVSNHNLSVGSTYTLTNQNTGKNMNLWNGDTSVDSNVVQWIANSTDPDQQWTLRDGDTAGTYQLETVRKANTVLDAYSPKTTGANADVWTNDDPDAQNLIIRNVGGNYHTLSLRAFPNLYLTAIGDSNGTQTGYGPTSEGNIYWAEISGENNQNWNFSQVVAPDYPTTSNHNLTVGKSYTLTNVNSGKNLNLWGGDYSKDSNVVQWTAKDGDPDQIWVLKNGTETSTFAFEMSAKVNYLLDAYLPKVTGANTDVWVNDDPAAQNLIIRDLGNSIHTISLKAYPHLFLTAIGTLNGSKTAYSSTSDGNVYWAQQSGEDNQKWVITEVQSIIGNDKLQNFVITPTGSSKFSIALKSDPSLYLSIVNGDNGSDIILQPWGAAGYEQEWSFFDYTRDLKPPVSGSDGSDTGSGGSNPSDPNPPDPEPENPNPGYPDAPPTATGQNPITVTGFDLPYSVRYFHPGAGLTTGDFYSQEKGIWIDSKVSSFFKKVFKVESSDRKEYSALFFGDNYDTLDENDNVVRQYHQGVDLHYYPEGDSDTDVNVYSAHSGLVVYVDDESWGEVSIVDEITGVYYVYAHMKVDSKWIDAIKEETTGVRINVGDKLGLQSNVGPFDMPVHLHFEVRPMGSERKSMADYCPSTETMLASLEPYHYM